jgi:hypothetical protein
MPKKKEINVPKTDMLRVNKTLINTKHSLDDIHGHLGFRV